MPYLNKIMKYNMYSFSWNFSPHNTAGHFDLVKWPWLTVTSTLRNNSSLHCISSYRWALSCLYPSGLLPELMIYSGVSYLFWECAYCIQRFDNFDIQLCICVGRSNDFLGFTHMPKSSWTNFLTGLDSWLLRMLFPHNIIVWNPIQENVIIWSVEGK